MCNVFLPKHSFYKKNTKTSIIKSLDLIDLNVKYKLIPISVSSFYYFTINYVFLIRPTASRHSLLCKKNRNKEAYYKSVLARYYICCYCIHWPEKMLYCLDFFRILETYNFKLYFYIFFL